MRYKGYSFEKGSDVPNWVYSVKERGADLNAKCLFGVSGRCITSDDGVIFIVADENKSPEDYIFVIPDFLSAAQAWHPGGTENLVITKIEEISPDLSPESYEPIPEKDPRRA